MDKIIWFGLGWWVGSRMATGQPIVPAAFTTGAGAGICPPGTMCAQAQAPAVNGLAGVSYANRGPVRYRRY